MRHKLKNVTSYIWWYKILVFNCVSFSLNIKVECCESFEGKKKNKKWRAFYAIGLHQEYEKEKWGIFR